MIRTVQHTARHTALAATLVAASLAATSAHAAQATASASGTVVTPIAITAATNLVFGSFAAFAGGTVTVSTSGVRSVSGVVVMGGATPSAARFDISGMASSTYSITHSGTAVLTNTSGVGGETMGLSKFSDLSAANTTSGNVIAGTLDAGGTQSLYVGATLTVGAGQVPGIYTGTVIATVEYN